MFPYAGAKVTMPELMAHLRKTIVNGGPGAYLSTHSLQAQSASRRQSSILSLPHGDGNRHARHCAGASAVGHPHSAAAFQETTRLGREKASSDLMTASTTNIVATSSIQPTR